MAPDPGPLPTIEVQHLSKRFAPDFAGARRLGARSITRELTGRSPSERPELEGTEFWALDDVSFEIRPGEALGVVGNNGAGKTTLLRLLHGILAPDWGQITVRGRATAIIEPGTAFDSWSTGREAIWSEGAILGLSAARIQEIEDDVIDFAELGDVIDAPVRTYSTGMRMRLGYAVAAHTDPDVMFVDEVLAVGDAAFQRKCISFILDFLDRGGSLVLVSHSIWQIRSVCSRCLVLDHGRAAALLDAPDALRLYVETISLSDTNAVAEARPEPAPAVPADVSIASCTLAGVDGAPPRSGAPVTLEIEAVVHDQQDRRVSCVVTIAPLDLPVTALVLESPMGALDLHPGANRILCDVEHLELVGSTYQVTVTILGEDGSHLASAGDGAVPLTVRLEDPEGHDQSPHRLAGVLGVVRPEWS